MQKENIKIYCKFNKNKTSFDNVICEIFNEYVTNRELEKSKVKRQIELQTK